MPELDDGTDEDGLRPLEPALLDVLEPELDAAELPELVDAAEFDAVDLCACPGRVTTWCAIEVGACWHGRW